MSVSGLPFSRTRGKQSVTYHSSDPLVSPSLYLCGTFGYQRVYPSYLMLHRYELLAMSDNLTELGIKRIRRVGHQTEFEQIKEYVKGDDYRTINWKASARRHELMVNVYQDERSQQIYSVIDKGG